MKAIALPMLVIAFCLAKCGPQERLKLPADSDYRKNMSGPYVESEPDTVPVYMIDNLPVRDSVTIMYEVRPDMKSGDTLAVHIKVDSTGEHVRVDTVK